MLGEIEYGLTTLGLVELLEKGKLSMKGFRSGISSYQVPVMEVNSLDEIGKAEKINSRRKAVFAVDGAVLKTGESFRGHMFGQHSCQKTEEERKTSIFNEYIHGVADAKIGILAKCIAATPPTWKSV